MQRIAWTRELDRERAEAGKPALTEREAMAEWADSCDLLFTDDCVLIRPDPSRMDLAFKADEALQTLVSKRRIRFLNTHSAKVRDALRARGENWRMARPRLSPAEIEQSIELAHVAIEHEKIYYYNPSTGTRWLTAGGLAGILALQGEEFVAQVREIVEGLGGKNRLGQPEIALFPASLPPTAAQALAALDPDGDETSLRAGVEAALTRIRLDLPANLREETLANFTWRAEMSFTLQRGPNDTSVGDEELVQGISPEFYRQIEWLPGARVVKGELIFDPIFDEAKRSDDAELREFCDLRARAIIFNLLRLFGSVEYVNVGRISHSLARRPVAGAHHGGVYLVQYKELGDPRTRLLMIRFQKWGIAEHLDEGKDMLSAITQADDYADYILDRRLACRQLGMKLPEHIGFGQFLERYQGDNRYHGAMVRANYYVRSYIGGVASDKVPPERFRNPAFAQAFAYLMGEAAALDLVVGRATTETGECAFDTEFEMLQCGPDGLPLRVLVTDHAGSFVKYSQSFDELVGAYARVVRRREKFVDDFAAFARAYVLAFERTLTSVQCAYRERRRAFDELFLHRPFDEGGSIAFRWERVLSRLDACDPVAVAESLKKAIQA